MKLAATRTVPCPHCRKPAVYAERNPWRPFCGERCRSADLGAWASEQFRMPAETPPRGEDTPPSGH